MKNRPRPEASRPTAGGPALPGWQRKFLAAFILALSVLWLMSVVHGTDSLEPHLRREGGPDGGRWTVLREAMVDGRPTPLPHRLDKNLAHDQTVEFRLPLPRQTLQAIHSPWGLCVPRWSLSASVLLDDLVLTRAPIGLAEVLDYSRPQYVALPPELTPGPHELRIQVHAWPGMDPGLSEVWLGDGDLIRRACGQLGERRRGQAHAVVFMLAIMGLTSATLSWLLRERSAACFALLALAWCVHARHLNVPDIPMSVDRWVLIFFATRTLFVPPLVLFCLQVCHVAAQPATRLICLSWGLSIGTLLLLPPSLYNSWLGVMNAVTLLASVTCIAVLLRWTLRERKLHSLLLLVAITLVVAANLREMARWMGWVPYGATNLTLSGVPLIFVGYATLLFEQLMAHRAREARSIEQLQVEVERNRAQIAADFERLAEQRERLLVLDERRRLVQDMHDVMGSHLVSATVLLKSTGGDGHAATQARQLIDRALLDLRCSLDVMSEADAQDPDDDVIATLLGTLRARMAPVFKAEGIELSWHCEPLPVGFLAHHRQRVDLMRLLLEALTNVLRHSAATKARLSARVSDGQVEIVVIDDGRGFDPNRPVGIGMRSMHRRATAIGASLQVDSTAAGTRLVLLWPGQAHGLSQ